jgi:hypothetical protein
MTKKIKDKLQQRAKYAGGNDVTSKAERIDGPVRGSARGTNTGRGANEAAQIPDPAPAPSAAPVSVTPPATSVTPPAATTTENTTTPTTPQDQSTGVDDVTPVQTPPPEQTPFDPGFGNVQPGEYSDEQKPDATGAMKRATPISMEDPATKSAFDIGREYRVLRTGAEAEEMARGVLPDTIPKIPDPEKIDRADTEISFYN